jgi:hypothetical protein
MSPLAVLRVVLLALSACGASQRGTSARSVIGPDAGLSPDAVHAVVRAHVAAIRGCFERFARAEGRPAGVVRLGWQIEPAGTVTSVDLVASTLHSAAIESCIADDIARWRFPVSRQATEIREYPFEF